MRILLCLHHHLDANQGAAGVTLALGQAFEAKGCKVEFFGFDHSFPDVSGDAIGKTLRFPWKLASFLARRAKDFDIIDVSTGDSWIWATRGRPGTKKRQALITRSHGLEHTVDANLRQDAKAGVAQLSWKYSLYHGGYRLWEVANSLRQADLSLMLNQHDLDYAANTLGVKRQQLRLVANGIPDGFLGLPFRNDETAAAMPLRIAQVGTYIARKGIVYSCQALNAVLARHKEVTMTFLGTGCSGAEVFADFNPAVREQVKVIPHYARESLPELLKNHQVILFPSLSEGFGLGLLEAMACGLGPVASDVPGPTEFARDEENALLVPPRDSVAIEQALERLIRDNILLKHLRSAAYATAQQYGWSQIAAKTLTLYEEALQARSA